MSSPVGQTVKHRIGYLHPARVAAIRTTNLLFEAIAVLSSSVHCVTIVALNITNSLLETLSIIDASTLSATLSTRQSSLKLSMTLTPLM